MSILIFQLREPEKKRDINLKQVEEKKLKLGNHFKSFISSYDSLITKTVVVIESLKIIHYRQLHICYYS